MSSTTDPRQKYLGETGREVVRIVDLPGGQRDLELGTFYRALHRLDQPLPYGTAPTSAAGNMDLTAAVGGLDLKSMSAERALAINELFRSLILRASADPALSGLGTQPHEEF